jgi:hypothetical protein
MSQMRNRAGQSEPQTRIGHTGGQGAVRGGTVVGAEV